MFQVVACGDVVLVTADFDDALREAEFQESAGCLFVDVLEDVE